MIDNKLEKGTKPIPVPYEEFENFPKHVEEFFDLIARRPFELLKKRPLLFGRELEHLWKTEPELLRPKFLRMYETEENLVVRAEVPGFTEKELNIACEPWRLVVTAKKEYREEAQTERKEEIPLHTEKMQLYRTIKFPVEVRPETVKATLRNGILELILPKAEVGGGKEGEDRCKALLGVRASASVAQWGRLVNWGAPESFACLK